MSNTAARSVSSNRPRARSFSKAGFFELLETREMLNNNTIGVAVAEVGAHPSAVVAKGSNNTQNVTARPGTAFAITLFPTAVEAFKFNGSINGFHFELDATNGLLLNNWTSSNYTMSDGTLNNAILDDSVTGTGSRTDRNAFGSFVVTLPEMPGTYDLNLSSASTVTTNFGTATVGNNFLHLPGTIHFVIPETVVVSPSAAAVPTQTTVPGDKVPVGASFTNPSENKLTFNGTFSTFISDDNTWSEDDKQVMDDVPFKIKLPPMGSMNWSTSFIYPTGLDDGNKFIITQFNGLTPGVDLPGDDSLVSGSFPAANAFGDVPGRDMPVKKLPIADGDGNKGTINVAPGVSGTVTNNEDGTRTINATIEGLGSFSIGVKSDKKTNRVKVKNVTVTGGNLKKADLSGADILGNLNFAGGVDELKTGDIKDDHLITIGGAAGDKPVKLTFDRVVDTSINSARGIASLVVTDWIDDGGGADTITAPYVTSVQSKGDKKRFSFGNFGASITTSDATKPISKFTIAGLFSGGIYTPGSIGSVTVGAMQFAVIVAGPASMIDPPALVQFSDQLADQAIGSVTIKGMKDVPLSFSHAYITAKTLGKISLNVVDPTASGNTFGLSSVLIKSLKFTKGGTPVSLSNVSTVGDADTNLDDKFIIRIVGPQIG